MGVRRALVVDGYRVGRVEHISMLNQRRPRSPPPPPPPPPPHPACSPLAGGRTGTSVQCDDERMYQTESPNADRVSATNGDDLRPGAATNVMRRD